MPELSIITVNLNNCNGLQQSLESIFIQSYTNYEIIVIDGGSDDGSKQYLEKNSSKLSYWISEKDNGIYNAMNKGIAKANGEYILFLNSGDHFYLPESLLKLFENNEGEDIIYGNLLMVEENKKQWILYYPAELTFGYFYRSSLPHQSTLIKNELFNKIGLYDEKLKIASDWVFFIKAICVYNSTYKYVNEIISVFYMGGISTKKTYTDLKVNERQQVLNYSYPAFVNEYKEYFEIKAKLNNYENSRAHQFVDRIIKSYLYKKIKK